MEIGIDIVEISRIEKMSNINSFLEKNFSKREIEYILQKNSSANTIAGLFACKEAFLKAVGIGLFAGIMLCEIEVLHQQNGKPYIEITPQINYYLQSVNTSSISVSISHDGLYAIAECLLS